MTKDIYKWWTRKALKGEILKLKFTYNELFDAMLKTQEENKKLMKAYNICNEANIDLKEKIKALRKELNERSYMTLEEENAELKEDFLKACKVKEQGFREAEQALERKDEQLTKAKELLAKWVELFKPKGGNVPPTPIQIATEQFLK